MNNSIEKYILAFDEINALASTSFTLAAGDASQVTDDLLSILIKAYQLGIQNTSEMLETEIEEDLEDMYYTIYQMIDGKTFADRASDHVAANDMTGLQNLAQSEFHRVYNCAAQDGASYVQNTLGKQVTKTWYTMQDDRVRDTHRDLESVEVGLNDRFYTNDGDSALYPGGFSKAKNNVNCRCVLTYHRKD